MKTTATKLVIQKAKSSKKYSTHMRVTQNTYEKVDEVARKTARSHKELIELMVEFACEHLEIK